MITLNFSQKMANSLSQSMQTSKIDLLEWLANEQDESFV
jgi:hypothetical protein